MNSPVDSEMLKRFFCFVDLTSEEARQVAGLLSTIDLENGETFFQQGEPSTALYLLISGEVQIRLKRSDGSPHNLVTLKAWRDNWRNGSADERTARCHLRRIAPILTSRSFPIARSMPDSPGAIVGQPDFSWRPRECWLSGSRP